jgi:hypothetical protein
VPDHRQDNSGDDDIVKSRLRTYIQGVDGRDILDDGFTANVMRALPPRVRKSRMSQWLPLTAGAAGIPITIWAIVQSGNSAIHLFGRPALGAFIPFLIVTLIATILACRERV